MSDIISIGGTIITVISTIVTIFSMRQALDSKDEANSARDKVNEYYRKLQLINEVDLLNDSLATIKKAKDEYNAVLSLIGDKTGGKPHSIPNKFKAIKNNLENIHHKLPEKYKEVHEIYEESVDYINGMIVGNCSCVNNEQFKGLQSKLNLIQQCLKSEKEELSK